MAPDALVDFHTGAYLGGYDNTTQSATHARALELAHAESSSREDQPEGAGDQPEGAGDQPAGAGDAARAFEHVFIMRLDMALTRSNLTCLLAQDGPMTRSEAGNADGFSYLPLDSHTGGRIFALARARARRTLSATSRAVRVRGARARGARGRRRAAAGARRPPARPCSTRTRGGRRRTRARRGPGATRSGAPRRRPGGSARAAARRRRRPRARGVLAARRPSRDYQNR